MSDVSTLLGARAHFVGFGVAHFRVDFSDNDREFSVSTQADVSIANGGGTHVDFRESKSAESLVDIVDASLKNIRVDEDCRTGFLEFDNGIQVRVWWPDKIHDNLFIVHHGEGGAWFVIG